MDSVSLRYSLIVCVVSQVDGWMYSVSLRYSLIVCVVSQIDGRMDRQC